MPQSELVNQPSAHPTRKVTAVGVSGAVATALIWALREAGIDLDPEITAALAAMIMGIAGYFARERPQ